MKRIGRRRRTKSSIGIFSTDNINDQKIKSSHQKETRQTNVRAIGAFVRASFEFVSIVFMEHVRVCFSIFLYSYVYIHVDVPLFPPNRVHVT